MMNHRITTMCRLMCVLAAVLLLGAAPYRLSWAASVSQSVAHRAHYPPQAVKDLRALAAQSTVSVKLLKKEKVGSPSCWCHLSVLLPSGLTERQQVGALLKTYYGRKLNRYLDARDPRPVTILGYSSPA